MATLKSLPISMIEEGRDKVLDKVAVFHKNVSPGTSAAKLFVYGLSDGAPYPLIYTEGTTYIATQEIPAGSWYVVVSVGGSSNFPSDAAAGYCYYTTAALTMAAGDSGTVITGYSMKAVDTSNTLSLLQSRAIPCETILYELQSVENLNRFYKLKVITKLISAIPEGD